MPPVTADPRSIVTRDAFTLSEDLLGTPLGGAGRRLSAMLIDLVFIGILRLLGWGVLGGVAALIGLRLATRRSSVAVASPAVRGLLGCGSALVFVVAVAVTLAASATVRGWFADSVSSALGPSADAAADSTVDLGDMLGGLAGAVTLMDADEDEALAAAVQLGQALQSVGESSEEARDAIRTFVSENTELEAAAVADAAVEAVYGVAPPAPLAVPGEALDTVLALEAQVDRLASELSAAEASLQESEQALEEAESGSTLFAWLYDAADEAGLIFGWGTVYLTLFLVLWEGRTPGKRAVGLRVVRLNGESLDLFLALERTGGYAAGFATGLLGFAQILWDPNRQAIHDKIAETVVIRETHANKT